MSVIARCTSIGTPLASKQGSRLLADNLDPERRRRAGAGQRHPVHHVIDPRQSGNDGVRQGDEGDLQRRYSGVTRMNRLRVIVPLALIPACVHRHRHLTKNGERLKVK